MSLVAQNEEVFHLAGDAPDPLGSGMMGHQTTTKLRPGATPKVRYKDFIIECDLYKVEGAPTELIMICPKCRNTLRVTSDRKDIEYDTSSLVERGGRLSVSAFECTWEADTQGRRMEFGLGLCRWKVAIEDNIARDA